MIDQIPDLWLAGSDRDPAIHDPNSGTALDYGELRARIEMIAGQLVALGIEPGDAVAYTLPNGPEAIIMFLAVVASGAAAAPLNPLYEQDEVARYLADIKPRLVVAHAEVGDATVGAARERGLPIVTLAGAAQAARLEDVTPHDAQLHSDAEQVALMLHTSGTTGRAKVVPLRRRNLSASAVAVAHHYALSPADVSYCVMPLFHVHGIVASTLAPLLTGGSVIAPRRFSAGAFWQTSLACHATWFSAVPTIHQILLERVASGGSDGPHAPLRFARSCSAPLAPSVMARFEATFEAPLVEAYGMTEAAHQMTSNPLPPGIRKPGSVGVPAGAEVRILNDDWVPLLPNHAGEVAVRGAGVVDGYLRNPEADAASFRDGWFRTGDSGRVDDDGYLHLEGRIKELINRGGEKISPAEVEAALLRHSAVADAAVYGVPDPLYGEAVAAAVVVRVDVDGDTLRAHCADLLAPFKVPATIAILDSIPKGPTGKVQRRLLPELVGPP